MPLHLIQSLQERIPDGELYLLPYVACPMRVSMEPPADHSVWHTRRQSHLHTERYTHLFEAQREERVQFLLQHTNHMQTRGFHCCFFLTLSYVLHTHFYNSSTGPQKYINLFCLPCNIREKMQQIKKAKSTMYLGQKQPYPHNKQHMCCQMLLIFPLNQNKLGSANSSPEATAQPGDEPCTPS